MNSMGHRQVSWAVLLVAGVLLIISGIYWKSQTQKNKNQGLALAQVIWADGQFRLQRSWKSEWEVLLGENVQKKKLKLGRADRLESQGGEGLILEFSKGERVHLQRGALVTVEQLSGSPLLILHRGLIEVDRFGQNQVAISHLGKRYTLSEWNSRQLDGSKEAQRLPSRRSEKNLTKDMIDASIKANRSYFMKCFAHFLQKKPEAKGGLVLNFTIQASGKVISPEVIDSVFLDRQFHDCVLDSLTRIPFPSFEGDSVTAMIPMQFQ